MCQILFFELVSKMLAATGRHRSVVSVIQRCSLMKRKEKKKKVKKATATYCGDGNDDESTMA